jgi:hypothetical protein
MILFSKGPDSHQDFSRDANAYLRDLFMALGIRHPANSGLACRDYAITGWLVQTNKPCLFCDSSQFVICPEQDCDVIVSCFFDEGSPSAIPPVMLKRTIRTSFPDVEHCALMRMRIHTVFRIPFDGQGKQRRFMLTHGSPQTVATSDESRTDEPIHA